MTRNKKTRRPYRPRPVTAHTMTLALHYAAKPAKADCDDVLAPLKTALRALREGVAIEYQWSIAAGAVNVAMAIEQQGAVTGLRGHLQAAEAALQAIYDRAIRTGGGRWIRVTLYGSEIEQLQLFFELHEFQIKQLGRAEFLAAIDAAQKEIIREGNTLTVVTDTQPERLEA